MTKRRVVVTGLGLITPVGIGVAESWENIVNGVSGITNISKFDISSFKSQVAGEVKNFNPDMYLNAKDSKRMDTFMQFGLVAGIEAIKDSGLEVTEENSERIGISIGSGIGGINLIETTCDNFNQGGPRKVSPFFVPGTIINMISGNLSIMYGIKGPNISIVTACTTGTHSIGDASRMIEYGDADVMIAGGSEAAITELTVAGFSAAKALSQRNDDPKTASRPWDKDRDGFVIGEGAGVMVIEEYEHAMKRGAKIYCELSGYGMSADAYHITAPSIDGPKRSMLNAIKNAGINLNEVGYINAHGTSTQLGDLNEVNAIKETFNKHAYDLVVNSTKSMTGHLLGGAGGIESVFTVLAVHHQISPPTMNIFNQDTECDLDFSANEAKEININAALKNNFGFGGTNGSLIFKRI
ncbi:beta-ketoacyl-ACP synthase II [Methylophilaceae bacterium]|jgi:3-oxoacyl-[acyl-carrier-protein] synthase II|nr:beta-ketoacyl-ACP synthase II [Methylophilaceae bacterium]|tara:strand:- start:14635 stop:15867 length:1233 start_codon:yes stop_codon:yes gene_type:complete